MSKPMTFNETLDWARGWLLVCIGKGDWESGTWTVVNVAWRSGYEEGFKAAKGDKK